MGIFRKSAPSMFEQLMAQQAAMMGNMGIPGLLAPEQPKAPMNHPKRQQTEVIVAYRAWNVNDSSAGVLQSMSHGSLWAPRRRANAKCEKHPNGPGDDCQCGIWAFKDAKSLVKSYGSQVVSGSVIGRIALWGVVQVHENGYRAQYAYPQLFFRIPELSNPQKLAEKWGVEVSLLPDDAAQIIEPYIEQKRVARFHAAWDNYVPPRSDIPILDVDAIREREKSRREHAPQGYAIQHYPSFRIPGAIQWV